MFTTLSFVLYCNLQIYQYLPNLQNLTFCPWRAWARDFLRITYTSFEMPYYCLTSCKKSKNSGAQFENNL